MHDPQAIYLKYENGISASPGALLGVVIGSHATDRNIFDCHIYIVPAAGGKAAEDKECPCSQRYVIVVAMFVSYRNYINPIYRADRIAGTGGCRVDKHLSALRGCQDKGSLAEPLEGKLFGR